MLCCKTDTLASVRAARIRQLFTTGMLVHRTPVLSCPRTLRWCASASIVDVALREYTVAQLPCFSECVSILFWLEDSTCVHVDFHNLPVFILALAMLLTLQTMTSIIFTLKQFVAVCLLACDAVAGHGGRIPLLLQ